MELIRVPDLPEGDYPGNEAISEIKSYLIRLDRRLRLIFDGLGTSEGLAGSATLSTGRAEVTSSDIRDLKAEIIRTANEIKLTRDVINLKLQNDYVAKSDIGEYTEEALQNITVDGKGITQMFTEVSQISGRMDSAENAIGENSAQCENLQSGISKINAYIRTGKLDEDVYGIEIGNFSDTASAPYKVRLSENRLSFYIGTDEVAYFSDNSMYISRANIPLTLTVGGCTIKNDSGLSFVCE